MTADLRLKPPIATPEITAHNRHLVRTPCPLNTAQPRKIKASSSAKSP